jgi:beta-glucosidase
MAPIFQGEYSKEFLERAGADAPQTEDGDMNLIAQPTDFLGLNLMRATSCARLMALQVTRKFPFPNSSRRRSAWINVTPQTLYWAIRQAQDVYGVESFILRKTARLSTTR